MVLAKLLPQRGDALLIIHVQHDFLPGGALPVARGREVVDPLNAYSRAFARAGLPVVATRDWHPLNHCSFAAQGGQWPAHCVAGTAGAQFASGLVLPPDAVVVDQATDPRREAYSGFSGTSLNDELKHRNVHRLCVGGLATEYCVLHTVLDGLALGYAVVVLADAVRSLDVQPGDGASALETMRQAGAVFGQLEIAHV